ncbi:MAG: PaeR7I family type II restriction endonuclease [Polyangiaceae bacterium]
MARDASSRRSRFLRGNHDPEAKFPQVPLSSCEVYAVRPMDGIPDKPGKKPFLETDLFHDAVQQFWSSKQSATSKKSQGGARDQNLHGKTMNGFIEAVRDFLIALGVRPEHVFAGGNLSNAPPVLPSYFRPSKNWDLIVVANSRFHSKEQGSGGPVLYAALELKSQDKSIGNNQNNRLEESIGNAHDFWVTYGQSGFERLQPRPWLGYLFVGKYQPGADNVQVRIKQPHFLAMPPFRVEGSDASATYLGPSYAARYMMFLRQAVAARLYDSGAFLVTAEDLAGKRPNHRILMPEFGPAAFLRGLKAQILAHYPGAEVRPGTWPAQI